MRTNVVMENARHHYSMLIEWSDEDQSYVVTLPEWAERAHQPVTHGETYEEAVARGREALELLVEQATEEGRALPAPRPRRATVAAD